MSAIRRLVASHQPEPVVHAAAIDVAQPPVNWRVPDSSDSAIENDVAHALEIGLGYAQALKDRGVRLNGASILELGPGQNYGAMLLLACCGARVCVADRFPMPWHEAYHTKLYSLLLRDLQAKRLCEDMTPLRQCIERSSVEGIVAVLDAPAENLSAIQSGMIDAVLSNAVLEHVQSPALVTAELHRITCRGGIGIHQIDFRDHRDFSRPLEYLLLSSHDFEQMFVERHAECGRQTRHFEMLDHFRTAGFGVVSFDANWFATDAYLDDFIPRLRTTASIYRDTSRDDLRVISGRVTVTKPAAR